MVYYLWGIVTMTFPAPATSAHSRLSRAGKRIVQVSTLAMVAALLAPGASAQSLPEGGTVKAGAGVITTSPGVVTIDQASQRLDLDWRSFSIGQGRTVLFNQPSLDALAVNRVIGSDPSAILGNLRANGQVFLINPNGIVFGKTAVVNVGGLLASTGTLSEDAQGRFHLSQLSGGAVSNDGSLQAAGQILLSAGQVRNSGTITGSDVVMAAAEGATVALDPSGRFRLHLDQGAVQAAVDNDGLLTARDGKVYLTASGIDAALASVSAGGSIASGGDEPGIVIDAGSNGSVSVSGSLEAIGERGLGGAIQIDAAKIALASTARLDVSGALGGGSIEVGGGRQGTGHAFNATDVSVAEGANLVADATADGNGGSVIIWSNGTTRFDGRISARGAGLGDGGFVETSGHEELTVGAKSAVNTLAPRGAAGDWLLDPRTITVSSTGSAALADVGNTTNTSSTLTIAAETINSASTNVVLAASDSITVNTPIAMTNNVSLTFRNNPGTGGPTSGTTFNASVTQRLPIGLGRGTSIRFDAINLFDTSYQLRDGQGVGVGAPQFGQRQTFLLTLRQKF